MKMEQNLGNGDAKEDMSLTEDSGPDKHAVFRTESIRGQPRSERAALETAVDSRKLRQRKMVRDYAEREKRKEKEASRQQKLRKKKISVIVKHLRLQKNHWKDFRMRSKVR